MFILIVFGFFLCFFFVLFLHLSMCSVNLKCVFNNEEMLIQNCFAEVQISSHACRMVRPANRMTPQTAVWTVH